MAHIPISNLALFKTTSFFPNETKQEIRNNAGKTFSI
jgi:hypothetical protein